MDAPTYLANTVTDLQNWAKQPFTQSMDVTGWALFTGLILCLVVLWHHILRDVRGEF